MERFYLSATSTLSARTCVLQLALGSLARCHFCDASVHKALDVVICDGVLMGNTGR